MNNRESVEGWETARYSYHGGLTTLPHFLACLMVL